MTASPQPTASEALAQNLEGYARDCIHIGSVESVNDLINAAAIIRDAIGAQPTSPSVDGETLEALALSFVSIISDGRAHEASSKTIASMILNELFLRRAALSAPRVEPVAWRVRLPDGGCTIWLDGKPPNYHGPYEVAYAAHPAPPDTVRDDK